MIFGICGYSPAVCAIVCFRDAYKLFNNVNDLDSDHYCTGSSNMLHLCGAQEPRNIVYVPRTHCTYIDLVLDSTSNENFQFNLDVRFTICARLAIIQSKTLAQYPTQ